MNLRRCGTGRGVRTTTKGDRRLQTGVGKETLNATPVPVVTPQKSLQSALPVWPLSLPNNPPRLTTSPPPPSQSTASPPEMMKNNTLPWLCTSGATGVVEPDQGPLLIPKLRSSAVYAKMDCPNPKCREWNHAENDACVYCDTPLPWTTGTRSSEAITSVASDTSVLATPTEPASLKCPACTQMNAEGNTVCVFCDAPLFAEKGGAAQRAEGAAVAVIPDEVPQKKRKSDPGELQHIGGEALFLPCGACTFLNEVHAKKCTVCEMPLAFDAEEGEGPNKKAKMPGADEGTDADIELLSGGPMGPDASTPARLCETQREDNRDATAGIIEALESIKHKAAATSRIYLCSPLLHFCQRQTDILGHWSCGYRNLQMLSSSLLQHADFKRVLYGGSGYVPEVVFLQRWIEAAWNAGYDRAGCEQLGGCLAGKSTWIGPTEVVALLRYFGLRAVIVSVRGYSPPGTPSGMVEKEIGTAITEFTRRYFSTPWASLTPEALHQIVQDVQSVVLAARQRFLSLLPVGQRPLPSGGPAARGINHDFFQPRRPNGAASAFYDQEGAFRPPLYFQHQGHSRTVIGLEEKYEAKGRKAYNLLIFDPSMDGRKLLEATTNNTGWQRSIKRGEHTLVRQEAYSMCVVLPGLVKDAGELEAGKFVDDELTLRPPFDPSILPPQEPQAQKANKPVYIKP